MPGMERTLPEVSDHRPPVSREDPNPGTWEKNGLTG